MMLAVVIDVEHAVKDADDAPVISTITPRIPGASNSNTTPATTYNSVFSRGNRFLRHLAAYHEQKSYHQHHQYRKRRKDCCGKNSITLHTIAENDVAPVGGSNMGLGVPVGPGVNGSAYTPVANGKRNASATVAHTKKQRLNFEFYVSCSTFHVSRFKV